MSGKECESMRFILYFHSLAMSHKYIALSLESYLLRNWQLGEIHGQDERMIKQSNGRLMKWCNDKMVKWWNGKIPWSFFAHSSTQRVECTSLWTKLILNFNKFHSPSRSPYLLSFIFHRVKCICTCFKKGKSHFEYIEYKSISNNKSNRYWDGECRWVNPVKWMLVKW